MHRVVVTGLGPVTPIGIGAETFLQAQHEAKNGIAPITHFDTEGFPTTIAGEVDVNVGDYIDRKTAKRLDRSVQFSLIGSELAIKDAGLSEEEVKGERSGTLIGSGIGGLSTWEKQSKIRFERHAMRITPFFIPMLISNMSSGQVAIRFGLKGPSSTVVTACATGAGAIGDAYRVIERGEADIMLTGGTEAPIEPMGIGGFAVMKALSTRNDSPETASRPFTLSRDGFVAAEGAGIVVLESLEHAQKRGARIYGEIIGYATSADAHHITAPAPGGDGLVRAVRAALKSAEINADAVDYINAHGTSTQLNDLNETLAYKTVFADKVPPISSTKSMTGHMLGAAGAVEVIASLQALETGVLPPTRNYLEPDPELDLDYVPNEAREQPISTVLSANLAFGGQNTALIFRKL